MMVKATISEKLKCLFLLQALVFNAKNMWQFKITHIHGFNGEKVYHQKPTKFCLKTSYFQEQLSELKPNSENWVWLV